MEGYFNGFSGSVQIGISSQLRDSTPAMERHRFSTTPPTLHGLMRVLRFIAAWLIAISLILLRWSCRVRWHDEPRPALRQEGCPYIYAILHCHQVAAVIGCEPGTIAMVSHSADGDLLVPSLRVHGIVPIRGSTRSKERDKGGAAALYRLIEHVRGGTPAYLAVDGPRGPRNYVNRGIAKLSSATGAAVLIGVPIPRRRWILARTWDRFQIPKPFTRIDMFFGPPLRLHDSESLRTFRQRIEDAIAALEEQHDQHSRRRRFPAFICPVRVP